MLLALDTSFGTAAAWSDAVTAWLLTHGVRIVVILVIATLARFVLRRAVRRLVRRSVESRLGEVLDSNRATRALASATGATHERRRQRTETLGSV
ncbi:MAG: hypothetical protein ABIV05_08710, partial [Actinomycetota bacterium]